MTRLLFVVQRYGARVAGGAETFCRAYAERLAARGFDIEVVSSCATNYVDWKNDLPEGSFVEDGVLIHRLPVTRPRSDIAFGPLNARVMRSSTSLPYHLQRSWMQMQGPYIGELPPWIAEHAHRFDAVVFFTYLYYPTWAGLPVASSRTTTVLHPTAHDEPPLAMPLFDLMFRQAHGFGFLTEEESQLVRRRFAVSQPFTVTGVGTELERSGDAPRFRRAFPELSDFPYLLYVGRLDPHKGSLELYDFFTTYKRRNPGPLKLVVMGDPVRPLPPHQDVITTGFVDEDTKHDAFSGATVFVHPSYFESFSIVLAEAWAHGLPALVQGHSAVLAGQCRRSGGGLPYVGYAEFEAALDLLLSERETRDELGRAGRNYVELRYEWNSVLDRYERFLGSMIDRRTLRTRRAHARDDALQVNQRSFP